MFNIIMEISKYLILIMIVIYTFECFSVFGYHDAYTKMWILRRQSMWMFMIHFLAFLTIFLNQQEVKILVFYVVQVVLLGAIILLYSIFYPKVSRLVVNNMCMLLSLGFIMLTRLSYDRAVKQVMIVVVSVVISLFVPVIIRKAKFLPKLRILYGVVGVAALAAVIVVGRRDNGALLGFEVAGINIQPSELVKIVFVFFVASSFYLSTTFKNVVITTVVAAAHVLILVASKDLGAALIVFVVYMVMLYVATRQPLYILAGLAGGSAAAVAGYYIFAHVRTRVVAWKDPFAVYDGAGFQIVQSLFAIGTGGWFGLGLCQGMPNKIPVVTTDFIFSAIAEELGGITAICLILICVSCYIMFLNIAMQLQDSFYKLVALGLGTCYIFQVFLTIGGVTKFIPSTGVTLPLVSYGGSSLLSTLIMFAIIQGLYILREDEEDDIERQKELRAKRRQKAQQTGRPRTNGTGAPKRTAAGNGRRKPQDRRQNIRRT
ncbi:FtsW/RodA/SpoVE family cell cycle protein [Sellimonas sp.]|uniref:FtsW/RodA/SpoVE family cell cycle protein n=1 Tax=Sellimonas sp. TaxID=2021466 RepID=UPI000B38EE67|nr:FtsW/RodA/SpoVE family cell cycle protein [Sellimonas sp.]OUP00225.1 cell division protein FtsW [Drancourtella sp. An210]OUP63730.1 cell division protein FtsW [Drancourtella sp. An177]